MAHLALFCALGALCLQTPTPTRTAPAVAAAQQRPAPNATVLRAVEVLDSLIPVPQPPGLSRADARVWVEQTAWFKDLRARLQNLLSMVVAPAKVPTPAPVHPKNLAATQEEAERESRRFTTLSNVLKVRHDVAMNAIRNMK